MACLNAVADAGRENYSVVTGGGPTSVTLDDFVWVDTMIGNVKNPLSGTYHVLNAKHLPRYLAEFCFRFNRRFKLEDVLPRLGYAAVRTPLMPFRFLRMAEAH